MTTNGVSSSTCAAALLDGAPGLIWYIRRHMRRHRQGVSVPQFRVLVKVQQAEKEVSLSCVAEHLGASLPTASRIVATLVKKGYLKREHCVRDRRQLTLSLTARGRAIAMAARDASLKQMQLEFSGIPAEERAVICRAFEILSRFVAAAHQGALPAASSAAAVESAVRERKARSRRALRNFP
jgi:DNA-binding MarR family transcriptional regulator